MASYTLKSPKTVAGKTITTIELRELEVDDVIALSEIDANDLRGMKSIVAKVFQVEEAVLGKLSMPDFEGLIAMAVRPTVTPLPGDTPSE